MFDPMPCAPIESPSLLALLSSGSPVSVGGDYDGDCYHCMQACAIEERERDITGALVYCSRTV